MSSINLRSSRFMRLNRRQNLASMRASFPELPQTMSSVYFRFGAVGSLDGTSVLTNSRRQLSAYIRLRQFRICFFLLCESFDGDHQYFADSEVLPWEGHLVSSRVYNCLCSSSDLPPAYREMALSRQEKRYLRAVSAGRTPTNENTCVICNDKLTRNYGKSLVCSRDESVPPSTCFPNERSL